MKWVVAFVATFVVAACMIVAYVFLWHSTVLERRDVMQLRVLELQHRPTVVQISGTSGNSALSVKKITSRIDGDSIDVDVLLFLARKGTSGSFQYDITVPDSVNVIRFGEAKQTIWKR
jgi:hypothetical protein